MIKLGLHTQARGWVQPEVPVSTSWAAVWAAASLGLPLAHESFSLRSPRDPWVLRGPLCLQFPPGDFDAPGSPGGGGGHTELAGIAPTRPWRTGSSCGGQEGGLPCWAPLDLWGLWPQVQLRSNLPPGCGRAGLMG